MANTQNKQELITRNAKKAVAYSSNYAISQFDFDDAVLERLTERGKTSLTAFEMVTGQADLDEWKKAFFLNDILKEMQKFDDKAKAKDLMQYFKGAKTNFYNYLKCGADVTLSEDKTLILPVDVNGLTFKLSNYALIATRKKEISEGIFTASMTQKEIQEKIKLLNSALKEIEAEAEEKAEAEIYDEEIEEPKLNTKETLEVYFNGKEVELTPEQIKAILKIIEK